MQRPPGNPDDVPMPHGRFPMSSDERISRLETSLTEGLVRLEQGVEVRLHEALVRVEQGVAGTMQEALARVERGVDGRMQRVEHQIGQLGQLTHEHHYVLQEALQHAPAANRHVGDLYRSLADRFAAEQTQLKSTQDATAAIVQQLGEVTSHAREKLLLSAEASEEAMTNLARLAMDIETDRLEFSKSVRESMHTTHEGQRTLVIVTAVASSLCSALVTLAVVVVLRLAGWMP